MPVAQRVTQAGEAGVLTLSLFPNVFLDAEFSEPYLLRAEEVMRVFGKIRKDKYSNNGDQDRQTALNKKEPPEVNGCGSLILAQFARKRRTSMPHSPTSLASR